MKPITIFSTLLGNFIFYQTFDASPVLDVRSPDVLSERDIVSGLGAQLSSGAAIYTPSSPNWANESSRWSTYSQPTFNYVVVPASENDIAVTIKYATSRNISFLAQGGGHGYSATLAAIQDAIMIRLEKFVYAVPEDNTTTMRVGGGTTFGSLISALHNAGKVLPVGVSPCVGATGATIGGGHGRLQGLYGLMIDAVLSHRIVLANGSIVTASRTQNADLFYALRGAGQNFGVITETIFKTYDDPAPHGLYYNVDMLFFDNQLESVLTVINDIIPNQPGELALIFLLSEGDASPLIKINLVWAGTRETGLKYSKMFNATRPQQFNESMISFSDLPAKSAGGSFSLACAKGGRQDNYSANMKYFNLTTMRTSYDAFANFLATNPGSGHSSWLVEIFGQQGENAVASDSTAYSNRGRDNIIPIISTSWEAGDDDVEGPANSYGVKVRDLIAATSGYDKLYIYQNYAHGDEDLGSIYGYEKARFAKLQCLKAKYDPNNVFDGYHNIPLPRKGVCNVN